MQHKQGRHQHKSRCTLMRLQQIRLSVARLDVGNCLVNPGPVVVTNFWHS